MAGVQQAQYHPTHQRGPVPPPVPSSVSGAETQPPRTAPLAPLPLHRHSTLQAGAMDVPADCLGNRQKNTAVPGGSCAAGPAPHHTPPPARAQMWEQSVPGSQGGKPNEFSFPSLLCVSSPQCSPNYLGIGWDFGPGQTRGKMSHNGKNKTAAQAFPGLWPSRAWPGLVAEPPLGAWA